MATGHSRTPCMRPDAFLAAARCPLRPAWSNGGLRNDKWVLHQMLEPDLKRVYAPRAVGVPYLTMLNRRTDPMTAALIDDPATEPLGETVMEDGIPELSRHMPIWLAAHGSVLVTGLGLGCVVRGLLATPAVTDLCVIERDPWIIEQVWPEFAADRRARCVQADAVTGPVQRPLRGERWNYAWHDIWADSEAGEPHLQVLHAELLTRYHRLVYRGSINQGAWGFPRDLRKCLRTSGTPMLDR